MVVEIKPLTKEAVVELFDLLTDHSASESFAAGAIDAESFWALLRENDADGYAGYAFGKVAIAYGVWPTTISSNQALLWMLVTGRAAEHPLVFIRHSRIILERLREQYAIVRCFVGAQYKKHRRWMEMLGFELHGFVAGPLGPCCEYQLRAA